MIKTLGAQLAELARPGVAVLNGRPCVTLLRDAVDASRPSAIVISRLRRTKRGSLSAWGSGLFVETSAVVADARGAPVADIRPRVGPLVGRPEKLPPIVRMISPQQATQLKSVLDRGSTLTVTAHVTFLHEDGLGVRQALETQRARMVVRPLTA